MKRGDLLDCRDDDHARGLAGSYPHPLPMELWQEGRFVENWRRWLTRVRHIISADSSLIFNRQHTWLLHHFRTLLHILDESRHSPPKVGEG